VVVKAEDVRRGRAEKEMWCSCWTRAGAVEANVREEDLSAARAVDTLRRTALDGAIVDVYVRDWMLRLKVRWQTSKVQMVFGHGFMRRAIGQLWVNLDQPRISSTHASY
jgi:hypothetical protein